MVEKLPKDVEDMMFLIAREFEELVGEYGSEYYKKLITGLYDLNNRYEITSLRPKWE